MTFTAGAAQAVVSVNVIPGDSENLWPRMNGETVGGVSIASEGDGYRMSGTSTERVEFDARSMLDAGTYRVGFEYEPARVGVNARVMRVGDGGWISAGGTLTVEKACECVFQIYISVPGAVDILVFPSVVEV